MPNAGTTKIYIQKMRCLGVGQRHHMASDSHKGFEMRIPSCSPSPIPLSPTTDQQRESVGGALNPGNWVVVWIDNHLNKMQESCLLPKYVSGLPSSRSVSDLRLQERQLTMGSNNRNIS